MKILNEDFTNTEIEEQVRVVEEQLKQLESSLRLLEFQLDDVHKQATARIVRVGLLLDIEERLWPDLDEVKEDLNL